MDIDFNLENAVSTAKKIFEESNIAFEIHSYGKVIIIRTEHYRFDFYTKTGRFFDVNSKKIISGGIAKLIEYLGMIEDETEEYFPDDPEIMQPSDLCELFSNNFEIIKK